MYMNTTYSTKQSAVAMRKRMSDDTNKYNFNRKRILDRIREGSIPQQNTTKKYDISNAEVNAIRKEGNHPPSVVEGFAASLSRTFLSIGPMRSFLKHLRTSFKHSGGRCLLKKR